MNFAKLEKNICDVVREGQIKLGYRKESIRLYYPLLTLNRFFNTDLNIEEMKTALDEFAASVEEEWGTIIISNRKERFCFLLPPEASEYIHLNTDDGGFLHDFIEVIAKHDTSVEEVINLFQQYSDRVHVEKVHHGEFDYLIYFEDGIPDEFRYCLKDEGCHLIYHRYTIEDYNDFGF